MTEQARSQMYNSMWKLRRDAWSDLEETCSHVVELVEQGRSPGAALERVGSLLGVLEPFERYWGFPGRRRFEDVQRLFEAGQIQRGARLVSDLNRAQITDSFRGGDVAALPAEDPEAGDRPAERAAARRPYFEVLVVDEMTAGQERALREELRRLRRPEDEFIYEVVVVPSFEDAVTAVMFNFSLQACVVRRRFGRRSRNDLSSLGVFLDAARSDDLTDRSADELAELLGQRLTDIRPELDLYLVTEGNVEEIAGRLSNNFRRVFHAREGSLELHLSILRGLDHRYRAPFFSALRDYSHKPTGVFHALPVSRGKSIVNSHWLREMVDFYGLDIFLAETSATCGGLDSLLEPTGPLRDSQRLAAETFGARETFFVTNGTSTSNKIVVQALVQPDDIVLVDRNCHQSHHYGLVLAGAHVTYLDAYRINEFSMYGAVPLREIKRTLLEFRRAGKLDRIKMLMLTNCTFDGIVYDVERVMEECLAIEPDLVFLWDEAWFAFARFHPVYRGRTAMSSARRLLERLRSAEHRRRHAEHVAARAGVVDDDALLDMRLVPDPDAARVRVYATQSTHKTLTSLRQGGMIHVFDQDYVQKVEETFHEAYMAHTSTSPNYQILASLDLGRRQAELEGFELVQKQVEYAMSLRDAIDNHPLLSRYIRCLTTADLIPREYRPAGIDQPLRSGLTKMMAAWDQDDFVLDPCRITLSIGATGIDGDTFKRVHLMDRFGVQVNKTSRNTVLFMTHIGTTRSSVAFLIEILVQMVRELDEQIGDMSPRDRAAHDATVRRLTSTVAPLPDFSAFHDVFRSGGPETSEGNMRRAFFLAYNDDLCQYLTPEEVAARLDAGEQVVSATFVTPYPPGFPVLVPGQIFSRDILSYMSSLDTPEVHGYRAQLGYRVFTEEALRQIAGVPAAVYSQVERRTGAASSHSGAAEL